MANRTSRLVSACLYCSLMATVTAGQSSRPSQTDTSISAKTELVEVPVVVRRGGKHVAGLSAKDFKLQQDGKDQAITLFQEGHSAAPVPRPTEPGSFTNIPSPGESPQQVTIIALDTINTETLDLAYFQKELISYLSDNPLKAPIGMVELRRDGIHVIQDFTRDPERLLAVVKKKKATQAANNDKSANLLEEMMREQQDVIMPDPAYGAGQAELVVERMSVFQDLTARIDSLLALQQLAQALKGIPGRKTLVYVSSGFQFLNGALDESRVPFSNKASISPFSPERLSASLDQHAYTWKLLNDANVAVYPIDARRTANPAFEAMDTTYLARPRPRDYSVSNNKDAEIVGNFESLAGQTGGKPCVFRTDLNNCLREAVDDNQDYYLLGFHVDKAHNQAGYHKLNIKLNQRAALRYREGFAIGDTNGEVARQTDLQLALNSPVSYTALPFSGRFKAITPEPNGKTVDFEIQIPSSSMTIDDATGKVSFDVVALVRARGGKEITRVAQRVDRTLSPENIAQIRRVGISYINKLHIPSGSYGTWIVVRDNLSARTGSVVAPLEVP